jgi:hypothetical protein
VIVWKREKPTTNWAQYNTSAWWHSKLYTVAWSHGLPLGVCTMCRVKCSSASEECSASVFSVTELLPAVAEVIYNQKYLGCVRHLECAGLNALFRRNVPPLSSTWLSCFMVAEVIHNKKCAGYVKSLECARLNAPSFRRYIHTVSFFSVTELIQADAEESHNKKCVSYVRSLERVWLITATEYIYIYIF